MGVLGSCLVLCYVTQRFYDRNFDTFLILVDSMVWYDAYGETLT